MMISETGQLIASLKKIQRWERLTYTVFGGVLTAGALIAKIFHTPELIKYYVLLIAIAGLNMFGGLFDSRTRLSRNVAAPLPPAVHTNLNRLLLIALVQLFLFILIALTYYVPGLWGILLALILYAATLYLSNVGQRTFSATVQVLNECSRQQP